MQVAAGLAAFALVAAQVTAATKTFNFKDVVPSGASSVSSLQDGGSVTAAATTTQMNVGQFDTGNVSGDGVWHSNVTASGFGNTLSGSGAAPVATFSNSVRFRSENTLSGTFAAGNWSVSMLGLGSVSDANAGSGGFNFRLWRSTNADGSGATQITGTDPISTGYVSQGTTAPPCTATFNPGAVTLSNEYLWIQWAWAEQSASTLTTVVSFWVDSANSFITTTNFSGGGAASASSSPSGPAFEAPQRTYLIPRAQLSVFGPDILPGNFQVCQQADLTIRCIGGAPP